MLCEMALQSRPLPRAKKNELKKTVDGSIHEKK
jgi:hypothetical protein